ncbi:MAG: DUF2802 domain-containing protein [Thiotrichales bacterium]
MFSPLSQLNPLDVVMALSLAIVALIVVQTMVILRGRKLATRLNAMAAEISEARNAAAALQTSLDQTRQEFHVRELYGNYNNNYLQAIETARRGANVEELMFRHGLGEAEAKLIMQSHRPQGVGAH